MEFFIKVLHFKKVSPAQRIQLEANECTYIRRLNLWLFEGEWDVTFDDQEGITEVGEIILGCIPDYSEKRLREEVAELLSIDPIQTFTPNEATK